MEPLHFTSQESSETFDITNKTKITIGRCIFIEAKESKNDKKHTVLQVEYIVNTNKKDAKGNKIYSSIKEEGLSFSPFLNPAHNPDTPIIEVTKTYDIPLKCEFLKISLSNSIGKPFDLRISIVIA
jgi:hypothetical protein